MSKHNGCDCEICKRHRRWDAALDELRSCVNDAESSWECEVTDRDMDLLNIAQELGLDGFNQAEVIARIKAMREVCEAQIVADDAIDAYEKDDDLDPEVLGAALRRRRQAIDAYRAIAALKAPTSDGTATVDDGFGTSATKCGDDCTLQVVRPGDIRCDGSGAKCPNKPAAKKGGGR